jgi:hypothetical protein
MSLLDSEQLTSERLHSARARAKLTRVGLSSESIQRFLGEVVVDGHEFPQEPDANWPIERPGG